MAALLAMMLRIRDGSMHAHCVYASNAISQESDACDIIKLAASPHG